jgi:hypothetical protein
VTLRWLALGLPLRDCRLRSRYTPGRLGFFNSPCLALPCLALPCLALPCLSLCPLSMAARSTRRQVALGETPPVGSFDRGWGHLKVCSPAPCTLFFSLPLVLLSFLFSQARTHAPLTVEAEGTTVEGQEVALFLFPCPFFVLVSLFLSPCRPRPRHLFACLLPFREAAFSSTLFFFLPFVYLLLV